MTTYAWPAGEAFRPQRMEWGQIHNQRVSTSPLSGYTQTLSVPGMRHLVRMDFPVQTPVVRAQLEAFLTQLSGMEHRVQLWDFGHGARTGVPIGTINRTGVTVSGTAAQFATSLNLTGCGASTTLFGGDKFSVNGQLLTAVNSGTNTADGSGLMAGVHFRPMLRAAAVGGSAVTLIKALFVLNTTQLSFGRSPAVTEPLSCEFIEVFA
jgi:hypothetical protein